MTAERSAATARAAAALAVARVLQEGRFLDTVLDETRETYRREGPFALSLIQEMVYGTLRWYHQLAGIAHCFLKRPFKAKDTDIEALLLIGLYQLRHLRVATHAAVDATVAAADVLAKSWATGVVNACLRSYLREQNRVDETIASSDELKYSHPTWLIEAIRKEYPTDTERLLVANNERPPMALRVNLSRVTRERYLSFLTSEGIAAQPHEASAAAIILEKAVPVEKLPGFLKGEVSIQDVAAQLAAPLLDVKSRERVLDACAAPGGKAAHILERTASAQLTTVEVDPIRMERLRLGLARLGLSANVKQGDAAEPSTWWDGSLFDRILIDAPCSATGVIRRHPDIKVRRHPNDLPKLIDTQARILGGVWPCLARGGKLLYATCSVLADENQRQLERFVTCHSDAVLEPVRPGANILGWQILPGENDMDGFYYGLLRKA